MHTFLHILHYSNFLFFSSRNLRHQISSQRQIITTFLFQTPRPSFKQLLSALSNYSYSTYAGFHYLKKNPHERIHSNPTSTFEDIQYDYNTENNSENRSTTTPYSSHTNQNNHTNNTKHHSGNHYKSEKYTNGALITTINGQRPPPKPVRNEELIEEYFRAFEDDTVFENEIGTEIVLPNPIDLLHKRYNQQKQLLTDSQRLLKQLTEERELQTDQLKSLQQTINQLQTQISDSNKQINETNNQIYLYTKQIAQTEAEIQSSVFTSLRDSLNNTQPSEVDNFLQQLKARGQTLSIQHYQMIIHYYSRHQEVRQVIHYLDEMKLKGIIPTVSIYEDLVAVLKVNEDCDAILFYLSEMKNRFDLTPSRDIYNVAIKLLAEKADSRMLEYYSQMRRDNIHPSMNYPSIYLSIHPLFHLFQYSSTPPFVHILYFVDLNSYMPLIKAFSMRKNIMRSFNIDPSVKQSLKLNSYLELFTKYAEFPPPISSSSFFSANHSIDSTPIVTDLMMIQDIFAEIKSNHRILIFSNGMKAIVEAFGIYGDLGNMMAAYDYLKQNCQGTYGAPVLSAMVKACVLKGIS